MGASEVRAYLSHLATVEQVAASTQNQALAALTCLYARVLSQPFERIEGIAPARRSRHVPVVLTPRESRSTLRHVKDPARLCLSVDVWERLAGARMRDVAHQGHRRGAA